MEQMEDWLKLSEWRYRHASADMAIEHDSSGWVLMWPKEQRMWGAVFPSAEEAMEFARVFAVEKVTA
jgi:hypothetical protein